MEEYITTSEQETEQLAQRLAQRLVAGNVIAFQGGLGVGKTAFTRGLARGLGITTDVSSPTFSLVHEYPGEWLRLYHFDMYRITDLDSLYSTGFFDYLDGNNILAIEWSENIPFALPEDAITVCMETLDTNHRRVLVKWGEVGGRK